MSDKQQLYYSANIRLPTEKAHGIQIMKMCAAFASAGVAVTLLIPNRKTSLAADPFTFYGVPRNFKIERLWCLDIVRFAKLFGAIAFWIEALSFAWSVKRYARRRQGIFYTRESFILFFLRHRQTLVGEIHSLPGRFRSRFIRLIRAAEKIVVISRALQADLVAAGIPARAILVAPDAVDAERLKQHGGHGAADQLPVPLPTDRPIIMYTGHFYGWKGADTLVRSAAYVPDALFVLIGGTESDHARLAKMVHEAKLSNVLLVPHQPPTAVPSYLATASVLVLPNSATAEISARYTSPLKLFEYMAAKKPIVASDLPSIREVVDDSMVLFCAPDDPQSLARALTHTLTDYSKARERARRAAEAVENYTWDKRASLILKEIA